MRGEQMWEKNVWECMRMCVSKCGCAKSVILDNISKVGKVEFTLRVSLPSTARSR